ncbi:hypothetical protein OROHE_019278 [Orobanche hederae]
MRAVCRGWKACLGTGVALELAQRVTTANMVLYDLPRFMWPGDTLDYMVKLFRVVPRIQEKCELFLNTFQPGWEVEGVKPGWTSDKVSLYLRGEFNPDE